MVQTDYVELKNRFQNHIKIPVYGTHLSTISSTTLIIIVYFYILSYLKIHDIVNSFTTNLIQSPRTFIRMGRYI